MKRNLDIRIMNNGDFDSPSSPSLLLVERDDCVEDAIRVSAQKIKIKLT